MTACHEKRQCDDFHDGLEFDIISKKSHKNTHKHVMHFCTNVIIHVHAHRESQTHTHKHTHEHTCTYAHTHTHTHAHTRTRTHGHGHGHGQAGVNGRLTQGRASDKSSPLYTCNARLFKTARGGVHVHVQTFSDHQSP